MAATKTHLLTSLYGTHLMHRHVKIHLTQMKDAIKLEYAINMINVDVNHVLRAFNGPLKIIMAECMKKTPLFNFSIGIRSPMNGFVLTVLSREGMCTNCYGNFAAR